MGNGDGFFIQRTNLFYPEKVLETLFNDGIGGPNMTNYICDDVLRDNCPKVYEENGLDEETCKSMYNSLPPTDDYGYLDEYTKGCRILHSALQKLMKDTVPTCPSFQSRITLAHFGAKNRVVSKRKTCSLPMSLELSKSLPSILDLIQLH